MKLTKRKGFNFFRSYYDVYNELETDKDKINFINALLDRQFLGIKPTDLKGMAKFAYISQTNSIDSQVKGYEDKTGIKLEVNIAPPTAPPTYGGKLPPNLQVQVQEEVQVQDVIDFDNLVLFINETFGRKFESIKTPIKNKYKARLKEGYKKEDITTAIKSCKNDQFHKDLNYKHCTPEYFSRLKTLDLHSSITETPNENKTNEQIQYENIMNQIAKNKEYDSKKGE